MHNLTSVVHSTSFSGVKFIWLVFKNVSFISINQTFGNNNKFNLISKSKFMSIKLWYGEYVMKKQIRVCFETNIIK